MPASLFDPDEIPRLVSPICTNCTHPELEHASGKCLYEPTYFNQARCSVCTLPLCTLDFPLGFKDISKHRYCRVDQVP